MNLTETDFKDLLAQTAKDVEEQLSLLVPETSMPEAVLFEAMRYSTLAPGKRLRPFMVLQSANLFGVSRKCALRVAAAVEMVHSYSLIHDDLPAMDDSDLRRGRKTTHLEFDEATAILAGDGLLTDAFGVLSHPDTHEDPNVRCKLIAALSRAAGSRGMVAGQVLDLQAEGQSLDMGGITRLQRLKTGALFAFCCEAGAILGRATTEKKMLLQAYAYDLGLAFQIVDDLLDITSSTEELGKSAGKDIDAGKATFVSILGEETARERAGILAEQAANHLNIFGDKAAGLKAVTDFVVNRKL